MVRYWKNYTFACLIDTPFSFYFLFSQLWLFNADAAMITNIEPGTLYGCYSKTGLFSVRNTGIDFLFNFFSLFSRFVSVPS